MYAQDSIDMLIRSGIDFTKHEEHGIDVSHFGELLMTSGAAFSRAHGPDDRYHVLDALAALGPLLPDAVHVQRDARSPPK